jgi:glutamate 5-kinase
MTRPDRDAATERGDLAGAEPTAAPVDAGVDPRLRLRDARRVVVKIGSRLIAESPVGRPAALADQIAALRGAGRQIVVVSSGAIALGIRRLRWASRPTELAGLQAAAAVGQSRLMAHWEAAFAVHDVAVGQVLLTHDDLGDRRRFLSARRTLRALLDHGAVPVINENDTVATEEIKFGDNDQLAALVCNLISADLLIILTDVEGVRDERGVRMPVVVDIERQAAPVAGGSAGDGVGSGGMASKVSSARIVTRTGVPAVVAPGRQPDVLAQVLAAADVGTLFVPGPGVLSSRKHWIAYGAKPSGQVTIDDGAVRALVDHRRSLLPPGVVRVTGSFDVGDTVSVMTSAGRELARGLCAYAAAELERIRGKHTAEVTALLGEQAPTEVIHRDDLVLL